MQLGAYRLENELGRGGAGIVYRAVAPDGTPVAVKLLARGSGEAHERFAREHRLGSALGLADGFVPVIDAGLSDRGPFLVMPLLLGGTLRARLQASRLSFNEALALVGRLAAAVARAHDRGIVHRDLKPENVLFDAQGRALVADLGLAKHFRFDVTGASASIALSMGDSFRGTAGFVPPEQLMDPTHSSPAGDVFALGAILYECIAGAPPFEGDSLPALIDSVLSASPLPLEKRVPGTPRWVSQVVERALAREPERRFPDAAAFARALAAPRAAPLPKMAFVAAGLVAAALAAVALVIAGRPMPQAPPSKSPSGPPNGPPPASPPPAPVVVSDPGLSGRELARRWALAAGAILAWRDGNVDEVLGGSVPTPETKAKALEALASSWHATARRELVHQLTWLRDGGDGASFQNVADAIARDPERAKRAIASGDGDVLARERMRIALEIAPAIGDKRLTAWDQSRLITLAGRGALVGWLSEDEAWAWIGPAAKKLQATYASWAEMGEHFRHGKRFWKPDSKPGRSDDTVGRLLAEPGSPWLKYDWRTDLESGSPWTPEPAGR